MPNYFSLTRKSEPEKGPVNLLEIDGEMCKHFDVPYHPKLWYHYWHDTIGFALATGDTFETLRKKMLKQIEETTEEFKEWDTRTLQIINWLDENFTSDAYARIGK